MDPLLANLVSEEKSPLYVNSCEEAEDPSPEHIAEIQRLLQSALTGEDRSAGMAAAEMSFETPTDAVVINMPQMVSHKLTDDMEVSWSGDVTLMEMALIYGLFAYYQTRTNLGHYRSLLFSRGYEDLLFVRFFTSASTVNFKLDLDRIVPERRQLRREKRSRYFHNVILGMTLFLMLAFLVLFIYFCVAYSALSETKNALRPLD